MIRRQTEWKKILKEYKPNRILRTTNLSAQTLNTGTYEELTTSTDVDVNEEGLPDRATYENLDHKLNANESSLPEYESLQQRELMPANEYESIKPKE